MIEAVFEDFDVAIDAIGLVFIAIFECKESPANII
jgi:hypothetical protein